MALDRLLHQIPMEDDLMTAKELQKRNEKSQHLRVVQVDEEQFYVESSEGKIC